MSQTKTIDENNLHRAFEIGLILKGIFALLAFLSDSIECVVGEFDEHSSVLRGQPPKHS